MKKLIIALVIGIALFLFLKKRKEEGKTDIPLLGSLFDAVYEGSKIPVTTTTAINPIVPASSPTGSASTTVSGDVITYTTPDSIAESTTTGDQPTGTTNSVQLAPFRRRNKRLTPFV